METTIHEKDGHNIAELKDDGILIDSVSDALDIMANLSVKRITKVIIRENNLSPEFFELRNGIAGEILQKFSTYGVQLAIVGDFSDIKSKSLKDFIRECNRGKMFLFVATVDEAIERFGA